MKRLTAIFLALSLLLALAACAPDARKQDSRAVYDVRYELNGGYLVSGELLQRVPKGGSAVPPTVARDGYVFTYWDASSVGITSNRVIVAQWERRYTIVFDPGAGTLSGAESRQILAPGELPEQPEAALDGAEFLGWKPEVSAASRDVTYKAQWKFPDPDPVYTAEEIYRVICPSVVEILVYDRYGDAFAIGSGFFINDEGLLVTNFHVMEGAYAATVTMSDGEQRDILEVAAYDKDLDLALVRADVTGNAFLELEEAAASTGEVVYAMGSSLGLTGTFSDGIVSTASRRVEGVTCVQTTAPISHGNSGGPLVNIHGRVLGINSMTLTEGQNLNFAISVKELDKLDRSEPVSMSVFGPRTSTGQQTSPSPQTQTGGFYEDFDRAEEESNDSYNLADPLDSEAWIAADLADYYDVDWFAFVLEDSAAVLFEAAPYYVDDTGKYYAVVATLGENELSLIELLEVDEENTEYVALSAWLELEPGTYFVGVTAADEPEIPEDEYPLYYAVRCTAAEG